MEALGSDPVAVDWEQCNQQDVAKLLPPFKPNLFPPNFYDSKSYYSNWSLTSYGFIRLASCVCLGGRGVIAPLYPWFIRLCNVLHSTRWSLDPATIISGSHNENWILNWIFFSVGNILGLLDLTFWSWQQNLSHVLETLCWIYN